MTVNTVFEDTASFLMEHYMLALQECKICLQE